MDARARLPAAESYESFFGFYRSPFSLAPDTRFVYPSASHRAAFAQVTYGLERREPILVVTGDIGTGKTLLCRTVLERLDRKTFVSIVSDPLLDRDELLKQMLLDFGVVSKDRATWAPATRHDLMHALQDFLASLPALHAHAAVVIDEAQHLQPDVLEDIRLLSNVHDERGTMLQIMLLGQDDLRDLLARHELRQLRQRVSRFVRLEPLTAAEVEAYINHRLAVARESDVASTFPGARELRRELVEWQGPQFEDTFTSSALRAVAEWSRGTPRVVNLLCDRALEAAFALRSRTVDAPLVARAAEALGLAVPSPPTMPEPRALDQPAVEQPAVEQPAFNQPAFNHPAFDHPAFDQPVEQPAVPEAVLDEPPSALAMKGRGRAAHRTRILRYGLAAVVVGMVAGLWLARRAAPGGERVAPSQAPSAAPAATSPPPAVEPAPKEAVPTAPTRVPTEPAPPAGPASTTLPEGAVDLVVASFRTTVRANDVAEAVAAAGEPVRVRATAGWQQVVAGPYRSRADGEQAQQRLAQAGMSGTQIVPAVP